MSDVNLAVFFPVIPASEVIVPQGNVMLPYNAILPSGIPATIQYSNYKKSRQRRLYKSVVKVKNAANAVASTAVPTLTSITVREGYSRMASALVGTNFDAAATLKLVSTTGVETDALSVVRVSATSITFAFPDLADGTYRLKIGNPGGFIMPTGVSNVISITNAPTFVSVTPEEGDSGAALTIVGGNFHTSLSIKLVDSEGVETACGTIVRTSITGATCTIPTLDDGVYSLKLSNPLGSLIVDDAVTVTNAPTFVSVTPEEGDSGAALTIVGGNFHTSLSIKLVDSEGVETVCGTIVRTSITGATCTIPVVDDGVYSLKLINPTGSLVVDDAVTVTNV